MLAGPLALFRGHRKSPQRRLRKRIPHRSPLGYSGAMPDRITIFRGPLCAIARDEADLLAQVRVTVLHEVGHYFGMSEARLHELGWA